MASLTTMEKLLLFHKLESDLFHRLVHDLAQDPVAMRWVIALWLWLESAGHHNFIRHVAALPGPVVLRLIDEAVACLRCLANPCQVTIAGVDDGRDRHLPCMNALMTKPIDDVGYFQGRHEILEGVIHKYRSICLVVCDAGVSTTCIPSNKGSVPAASLMVSSPSRTTLMRVAPSPLNLMATPFPLNPMATPWIPVQSPLPDDYRSLFITFSKGYPIRREDIMEFFNLVFGPCVETVMVEKVAPGQLPVYGRVILRSTAMIPVVLDGQQTAKFLIKGRHLWARMYIPSSKLSDA
ncbi:hypothetical protein HU200_018681 [Digitaria exilis]|uniref:Uncharacterized protein n=1 Tax=Digitaria exilis TaxID=1010633 RepID=A0A835F4L5_9POAL|nr:hypothetical protein HU200_018681 [Digitaria exilis]CAB3500156.1 unnamed protein product [Digitaria exilis]